ncbi:MAG TPA: hypothetical protein VNN08_23135 [Thermoanaerobaculia bacterium]|nr:hypothetical protein [Thermoanaerobaculia bacterium]
MDERDPETNAATSSLLSWTVRASSAVFGLSLAIGLSPRLALRARPEEMISALKLAGYSPKGLVLQFLLAVLLTAGFAIVGDRIARHLAPYRWAAIAYSAALLLTPVSLMSYGNLKHVLLLGAVAAVIVAVRRRDPHFSQGDVVLIPVVLACYMAFLDIGFGHTAIATFLRAAIAILALRLLVPVSDAFVAAPLALAAEIGLRTQVLGAAIALIVIFATPFLLARMKRPLPRRIIYPIVVLLYPLAAIRLPSPVVSNFFEDGHDVPVAAEMVRGERPYTDIIPTHGLVTDGALYFAATKAGLGSLRDLLNTRLVAGFVSGVAIYCLVLAATGTPNMALFGAFLTFSLFPGSMIWLRPSAAIFALAATVAATRLRSRRWFMAAGALVVVAYLVSIDFGIYSAIVALFAAFRARALRALAIGIAAAAVPALVIFAAFGFALDFIRVNVQEILGSHSAYFVQPLEIPEPLRSPALVHHLAGGLMPITWCLALITTCAALARSPLRARRSDGPWLIGIWMVVALASSIERGNPYYFTVGTPFLFVAIWTLRRHARTVAAVLMVIIVLLAEPFRHVISVIPELRRAKQGPMFDPTVTTSIRAARQFAATLRPSDTFVDFSNSALLYALLNRDCPLRQVEVASYQTEEGQREVIERIEHNPHIRAALITFPGSIQTVDGIPNAERAPKVWAFLQKNFTPVFNQDGVVFWNRNR